MLVQRFTESKPSKVKNAVSKICRLPKAPKISELNCFYKSDLYILWDKSASSMDNVQLEKATHSLFGSIKHKALEDVNLGVSIVRYDDASECLLSIE